MLQTDFLAYIQYQIKFEIFKNRILVFESLFIIMFVDIPGFAYKILLWRCMIIKYSLLRSGAQTGFC